MGRQHDERARIAQGREPADHALCAFVVQARERLVEQQHARRREQDALERETLTHAARKAFDEVVTAVDEARVLQRTLHGGLRCRVHRPAARTVRGFRVR